MKRLRYFCIRINEEEHEQLHAVAKHYGVSVAEIMRGFLRKEMGVLKVGTLVRNDTKDVDVRKTGSSD